jgi:phosphatidylserine/phosphatidylglycerophosphate/cardiolipin synthase-like enzyme
MAASHRAGIDKEKRKALMTFQFRRLTLLGFVLAGVIAYSFFSGTGWQGSSSSPATDAVPIKGPSSIQGPYFSDRDRISDRMISAINHTRRSLDIAVYSITQPDLTAAIQGAHRRGVKVRIVTDEGQSFDRHSETGYLRSVGVPVRLSEGFRGQHSLMHNKFAIFDGNLVETGSYNWTTSATSYNFENALFIRDPVVSARYEEEFEHIWAQAQ